MLDQGCDREASPRLVRRQFVAGIIVCKLKGKYGKITNKCILLIKFLTVPDKNNNLIVNIELTQINSLNPELNPICYLLALLGAHHFLHVSRIRVKLLTFRLLMSYIYGAPILDVSRAHTTTQHSR